MIKESTASVFVFHRGVEGWRVALIRHPRMGEWMSAGGHVEADENPAEAALREVGEETGLRARLVKAPGLPLPPGFPHRPVAAPWWIVEMGAAPDSHTAQRHVHVDHVFLAIAEGDTPEAEPAHAVSWFTADQLAVADEVAEDSRSQARELFALLPETVAS